MSYLGLIVKSTRACNLRCAYCNDWRATRETMSFEVLARLTKAAVQGHSLIEFMWHGGEPTLLPIRFYEKALLLQAKLRRPGQVVTNSLQTNGTLLNPGWARFFRDNNFKIGVSLDGPALSHDASRRNVSGRASYDEVRRGMSILNDFSVPFGVLIVVDEPVLQLGAERVFSYLLDLGVRSVGLIACKPANRPEAVPGTFVKHYVEPRRMIQFLCDMYDCWKAHGDDSVRIRELDGITTKLSKQGRGPCTLMGACIGEFFAVEPNGSVAHCDVFVGDDDYVLGNVLVDSFESMRRSARARELRLRDARELEAMRQCSRFDICQGWCPHERYTAYRHDPNFSSSCCGLAPLIDHVEERRAEAGLMTT